MEGHKILRLLLFYFLKISLREKSEQKSTYIRERKSEKI